MILLHGRHLHAIGNSSPEPFIARVAGAASTSDRSREVLLLREQVTELPRGYRGYLLAQPALEGAPADTYELLPKMQHLAEGDVIRIDPRRSFVSALYRRSSPSNSMLVTERCDNYCLMCSQPPKPQDDSWLVDEWLKVIPLISPETQELGITGGEPALLGPKLVVLLEALKEHLPRTAVHVLSNGRRFAHADFARAVGRVRHTDIMIGIPIYSDLAQDHDYVVQARGAFSETIRGILNLKRERVKVEIRVVLHADTVERLPELAAFIARNLLFVDHVALMGLELMGFAKTNLERLWIDPVDYMPKLTAAVDILARAGLEVSIYNHQLCVLPRRLHPYARKSISDWKNMYVDECSQCDHREACGGFFASSELRRSRGIAPMRAT